MKAYYIISFLALVSACQKDDVRPLMKIEANIGEPFIVSAPAEVVFKESGLILYIDSLSSYIDFGFLPPRTTAVIRYRDRKIYLSHNLHCDQKDCEGFTYNEQSFLEEAKLGELHTLKFNKVIASTIVKEYESGGHRRFRVDSAQFILRVND